MDMSYISNHQPVMIILYVLLYVHAMIIPSHPVNPITDDRLRFRIPPTVLAARRAANEAYWVGHPSFDPDFGGTLSDYSGLMDFNGFWRILNDLNGF